MNWKRAILAAMVVVPLLVVFALGFGQNPHEVPSMLKDRPAPGFNLPATDGRTYDLGALRGKPVVLNFWATWCFPCQAEHGLLQEAAQYYGERVQFLGVIYQDEESAVRKYLQKEPSVYPHLLDTSSRTAIDYGVAGVPESFIIAPDGMVVHKQTGVLTADVLRRTIEPLLAGVGAKN